VPFLRLIDEDKAGGELKREYDAALGRAGKVCNIVKAMSKDLKRRGFRFAGPTICYAFMQATGMVNDHLVSCFRHRPLANH
jgi:3-methyladenine DNA glycosylase Tag